MTPSLAVVQAAGSPSTASSQASKSSWQRITRGWCPSDTAVADCNARIPGGNPKMVVNASMMLLLSECPRLGSDQDLAQTWSADRLVLG
jgi:hypothetical protein